MHCLCVFLLFVLPAQHLLAQSPGTEFKGVAYLNQQGGEALAGIEVSADGASNTLTDSNGRFKLIFGREPGDPFHIHVDKQDYVVVNWIQLRGYLPKQQAFPLDIILAKEDQREFWARSFYRLKSIETIEREYQQRLAAISLEDEQRAQKLAQLERDKQSLLGSVDELSRQLAEVGPDKEVSSLYAQAFSAFSEGKLNHTLEILNEAAIEEAFQDLKKQEQTLKQKEQSLVDALILKGLALQLQFKFEEARELYIRLASKFPENFEAQVKASYFFQSQNQWTLAEQHYHKALLLTSEEDKKALVLNNLGNLQSDQNNMDAALASYQEALSISRKLAEQNPAVYLPDVAMTLNNLGNLQSDQNNMDAALASHQEALAIRRTLAEQNPAVYLPNIAISLFNLGLLYEINANSEEAIVSLEEAVRLITPLVETGPAVFKNYLERMERALNRVKAKYEQTQSQ